MKALASARARYEKAIALFAAMPGSDPGVAKALAEIRGKVAKLSLPVDPR